jgi:hypothetical protein
MPALRDHGLELVDPSDMLKIKEKSLKDMGKDNFDLSAHRPPHVVCTWEFLLKSSADVILQDVEGSPILAIKDVKHAAAMREASSKADAYVSSQRREAFSSCGA